MVLVIEDRGGLSRRYGHVFDHLGIRMDPIRTMPELVGALNAGAPLALIWDLASTFDRKQVGHALADARRDLPLLIIGDDDPDAEAALASIAAARNNSAPTHLVAAPCLRDVAEFLFRAGRHTGQLRVLQV